MIAFVLHLHRIALHCECNSKQQQWLHSIKTVQTIQSGKHFCKINGKAP